MLPDRLALQKAIDMSQLLLNSQQARLSLLTIQQHKYIQHSIEVMATYAHIHYTIHLVILKQNASFLLPVQFAFISKPINALPRLTELGLPFSSDSGWNKVADANNVCPYL